MRIITMHICFVIAVLLLVKTVADGLHENDCNYAYATIKTIDRNYEHGLITLDEKNKLIKPHYTFLKEECSK